MDNNADNWLAERGNRLCKWQWRRDLLIVQKFKFSEIFTHHKLSEHFIICLHIYKVVILNDIYTTHYMSYRVEQWSHKARSICWQVVFFFLEFKYNNIISWLNACFSFQMKSTLVKTLLLAMTILQGNHLTCIPMFIFLFDVIEMKVITFIFQYKHK